MKHERVVYYSDPLNDDFAGTKISTSRIGADFCWVHPSILWKALSFLLYYGIALPLVWLTAKLWLGLKFENRKVLRSLRGKGFFLYGNHTQTLDAYIPALAAFPHRAYTVANADAVSIPGLRHLVMMLGALPLPSDLPGFRRFLGAISTRCHQHACIAIYPEAHVWPYYTGIRPFPDDSFCYPVKEDAPVVAMVTTYRRRSGLFSFCKRPGMTVTFSEVFHPDAALSPCQARAVLRQQVFGFMDRTARSTPQVTYVRYEQRE